MDVISGKSNYHYKYLDLIRCIALFLVMYGHLVHVAMYSTSVYGAISENNNYLLPILDSKKIIIDYLEILFSKLGVQTAVVGVVIFFLLTGCLSVNSLNKQSKSEFLHKKIIRLAPGLWTATVVSILLSFFIQHDCFAWYQIISQIFMIHPIIQVEPISGVIWTLAVEIIFYISIIHVKNIDFKFVIIANVVVALCIYSLCVTSSPNMYQIVYFIKFIPIILIGTTIKLSEQNLWYIRGCKIALSVIFAWINLNFNKVLNGDETTYPNIMTGFVAIGIFEIFYLVFNKRRDLDEKIPGFVSFVSDISYMIYLLQIYVGFNIMYVMKLNGIMNNFMLVLSAFFGTILVSWMCHVLIEKRISLWLSSTKFLRGNAEPKV